MARGKATDGIAMTSNGPRYFKTNNSLSTGNKMKFLVHVRNGELSRTIKDPPLLEDAEKVPRNLKHLEKLKLSFIQKNLGIFKKVENSTFFGMLVNF